MRWFLHFCTMKICQIFQRGRHVSAVYAVAILPVCTRVTDRQRDRHLCRTCSDFRWGRLHWYMLNADKIWAIYLGTTRDTLHIFLQNTNRIKSCTICRTVSLSIASSESASATPRLKICVKLLATSREPYVAHTCTINEKMSCVSCLVSHTNSETD